MKKDKKIVLVGCGSVGTSFVYSAINQGIAQNYVLIDVNNDLAEGNAIDMTDAQAVLPTTFQTLKAGTYDDCKDADVIVITAGRPQKPGETRLDMVADNAKIMKTIALSIKASGFDGITIIASNPVDVLTQVYKEVTGYPKNKVISSGTTLDSSRLQKLLAKKMNVAPRGVHAHLIGEHGDSSVAAWSKAVVMGRPLKEFVKEGAITEAELKEVWDSAVHLAYQIIEKKRATFYGIGACLAKIVRAILIDEKCQMLVGTYLEGEYGVNDVYVSVPCIVGENGVEQIVNWDLDELELKEFKESAEHLKEVFKTAKEAIK
ncbi:L-lactate dehydrogenase [Spiroplasma chinense]|uniref:L-lactate dehydrogenase n=1 Tax=Spiroplasma chinense TaxID=216932 RepID=A0A5B9Y3R5_9MOLU|nr:L-lactate dehydrogenase [Spiroplasma chinense]QEH61316.1 L-lactate dehydrogenase [Spiroplasma chinense]